MIEISKAVGLTTSGWLSLWGKTSDCHAPWLSRYRCFRRVFHREFKELTKKMLEIHTLISLIQGQKKRMET